MIAGEIDIGHDSLDVVSLCGENVVRVLLRLIEALIDWNPIRLY